MKGNYEEMLAGSRQEELWEDNINKWMLSSLLVCAK